MNKAKVILIAILLLIFSTVVFAQGITGKGIKVGLNLANWTGDDADFTGDLDDKKIRTGFVFGGFITYEINETFSLQPEVYYSMMGVKYESSIEGEDFTVTFKTDYIQIPILAKFNLSTKNNVKPNIFIGPALSINLNAKYEMEVVGQTIEGDMKDFGMDIKSTDFGLVFGAGVNFGKISVDARYNLGLSTIPDTEEDVDIKNSVISIMLGYSF